ncbi:uncharacterized protein LOC110691652 [Chenopodium quinoa]|uniref:uncharacterized protein LOC110691652 n=1 Tax=Chenopodium quinoa TaxID=63459 RepID=UPI000B796BAF|nr:uncharacterized protein LOC110691652 [Chenopodium quinoa]
MASFHSLCFVLLLLMINSRFTCISAQLAPVSVAPSDGLLPNGNFEEAPNPSNLKKTTIVGKYSLPKWVKKGEIRYVSGGPKRVGFTFDVPQGVHAVSIGNEAYILQYLRVKPWAYYSVSFSATRTCPLDKYLRVTTSYSDTADYAFPNKALYSRKEADTYAWGFQAFSSNTAFIMFSNPTGDPKYYACGPLIQAVAVKELLPSTQTSGNLIQNGNFEIGPHILQNFTTGVYIHPYSLNPISPLPGWRIESRYTIRYIGSKDFFILSGASAVELLVGGKENAISQDIDTTPNNFYNLTFTIGDAKNGCIGSMAVEAAADKETFKVLYESQGKGGVTYANFRFKAVSFRTKIAFWSVFYHNIVGDTNRFCGPVLDDVKVVPAP